MVCYNCKKLGHIKRDCQEKHSLGWVNGEPCRFHLDTGADIITVPQNFVKESQYTGEVYNIQLGNLKHESIKMDEIMLKVEGKTQPWKVDVIEGIGGETLLGVEHPVTLSLFGKSLSTTNGDDPVLEVDQAEVLLIMSDTSGGVCAITRAKSQAQVDEIAQHEAANAKDGAVPIPLTHPMSATSPRCSRMKCKFGLTSIMPTTDFSEINVESNDEVEVTASPSVNSREGEGTQTKDVVEKKEDLESSLVEADSIVGLEKVEPNGEALLLDITHYRDGIGELIA